jgi:hypothetical protein
MHKILLVVVCATALVGAAAGPAVAGGVGRPHGPVTDVGRPAAGIVRTLNCSTPLQLYDGTYEAGAHVGIAARGVWVNLNTVNFGDKTSSYVVGSCAVDLADGQNGTGSHYPYCLTAGCVENVMASGWNNVISSVYLH